MALKERAERAARGKPVRAISWVAVAAVFVGVVVGVGVGFKVEQHRVHGDISKLRAQLGGSTGSGRSHAGSKAAAATAKLPVERVGNVTATGSNTITIMTKRHGSVVLHLASSTHIEQTAKGSVADIAAGHRVLVAKGAREVIVLPNGQKLGRNVTKVSSGVATVTTIKGAVPLRLSKIQAVDTTSTATPSAVTTGSHILAWYTPAKKGTVDAIEIIVLPAGSAFA